MALTLHCNASSNLRLYANYDSSGIHTGDPPDGTDVEVWDDELDGISDVMLSGVNFPVFRHNTPLMLNSCVDFDGTDDVYLSYNQTGLSAKSVSSFYNADSALTVICAIYPESITLNDSGNPAQNHCVWGDQFARCGLSLVNIGGTDYAEFYRWNGSGYDKAQVAITVATSMYIMCRLSAGVLYISVNGGAEVSSATSGSTGFSGSFQIGRGIGYYHGRVGEFEVYDSAPSVGDLAGRLAYYDSKWITGIPIGETIIFNVVPVYAD
jgi:hypothetical protein